MSLGDPIPPELLSALADVVKNLLGIIVATFVGALAAFRYETRQRQRLERQRQIADGQRALFALVAQISALENLDAQHLAPVRGDPARDLKLLVIGVGYQVPRCDVDSLMFLLEKEAQLLARLLDGQQTFDSLFNAIEQRNRYHIEFQERLAALQRSQQLPPQLPHDQLRNLIGPNIVVGLSQLTQQVFEGYERARTKIHANFATLREALSTHFPRAKFFTFELVPRDAA